MFDWEALKQSSQLWDKLLPCLEPAGRKLRNTHRKHKSGQGTICTFCLLSLTNPLLYGSQFYFVAVQLPLKSRRRQRNFAFDWVVESCLFIELNTNTHRCTYTHRSTVTHTQEYMQSLVETGRHPRCITLPFISKICHHPCTKAPRQDD